MKLFETDFATPTNTSGMNDINLPYNGSIGSGDIPNPKKEKKENEVSMQLPSEPIILKFSDYIKKFQK